MSASVRPRISKVSGARRAKLPSFVAPQLATLVKEPPAGDEWLHELKFDGYRMLCRSDHGKVRFWSRNRVDWTAKFPGIARAIQSIAATAAIFDGEVVVMDSSGCTSFQKL